MGKRIDILNSLYDHLSSIVDGYSWEPLYSTGNGAITVCKDACANFKIMNESSSDDKGQSLFFLSAMVEVRAYKRYTLSQIGDNDIREEEVKSELIEQLRKAYGDETNDATGGMCQAGVNRLDYVGELDPDTTVSDMVAVKLEFEIEWYDNRR